MNLAADNQKISLAGGSLRDVQALLGHRSLTTTQKYLDQDVDAQRKVATMIYGESKTERCTSLTEFLALLTSHIPDTYESMTRYYGYYSCRSRGERKKKLAKQKAETVAPVPEPRSAPSSSWAACIKRVYEIDPLERPRCQAKMRIVAFIHDPLAIANITRALGLPDFTAPPKIPRRSREGEQSELCVDEIPSDDA